MKQNMKRVLLVLCMAACLFSLSACSSASDESTGVDAVVAQSLKQQTVGLLESIASVPAEQMAMTIEYNRENGAEAVAVGLENYQSVAHELGAYVSAGGGSVTTVDGGYLISIDAVFTERPVTFDITLSEDMVTITSMSFNPVYTTGEKLEKAAMNTLMGMGTVFIVLIFISILIGGFRYINMWETKRKNKMAGTVPEPAAQAAAVPAAAEENLADDLELVAVITAAIAASENTSADGLVVRSIRRASTGKWKRA